MRRALLFTPLSIALLVALAASCGGSASETPWPVEPPPSLRGPAGESAIPPIIEEDAGQDGGSRPAQPAQKKP